MMSDDPEAPLPAAEDQKVAQGRHRCIVLGLLFIAACAIAAIVLPLVLNDDDCNCSTSREIDSTPTQPPPVEPTSSPAPTASEPPAAEPTKSPAPTPVATSERLNQLIDMYLIPISGGQVFQDPSSPQYQAAQFIADVDQVSSQFTNITQVGDRYALATFYYAMDGDNWFSCYDGHKNCTTGNSWMDPQVNHCEWSAVNCNDDGRVVDLFFATSEGNGLVGTIPPEISQMTEMQNLVAVNNLIAGTFPDTIGKMTNLKRVVLPTNVMTGTLPEGFMVNTPLEILILSNNKFSGEIPKSLGEIPTLTQLLLGNNRFDGSIPSELSSLELLGTLDLSKNARLRGSIPDSIFTMSNLENLLLDGSQNIVGEIGSRIGGLSSLGVLRLGGTRMDGTLPEALFNLTNLSEIDLKGAEFSGTLSENFARLAFTLRILRLSNNTFTGEVPAAFDSLEVLNALELEGNNITGAISSTICSRRGSDRGDLNNLTVDCTEITCDCCTNCKT